MKSGSMQIRIRTLLSGVVVNKFVQGSLLISALRIGTNQRLLFRLKELSSVDSLRDLLLDDVCGEEHPLRRLDSRCCPHHTSQVRSGIRITGIVENEPSTFASIGGPEGRERIG